MIEHYVQVIDGGMLFGEKFWSVEATAARRIDVVASYHHDHHPDPGEDMITTLEKRYQGSQFHKLRLAPGEYYPRMARPSSAAPESSPGNNPDQSAESRKIRTISTGQLHALIQQVQQICTVVHPDRDNLATYGHEIRNTIIIACTEVEAQWKNILKANRSRANDRSDYVKLSLPMKLGEFRIALPWYPWLDTIVPFENWTPPPPGQKQNLLWYDAYNNIKHDRETCFAQATLENALKSVTACFVMLCAQYGWDFARRDAATEGAFFQLVSAPSWEPSEIYVSPYGAESKAVPYSFPA